MRVSEPHRHLAGGSPAAVIVPARVARYIDRLVKASRIDLRGTDHQLTEVLEAIHIAGLQFIEAAANGKAELPSTSPVPISDCGPGWPHQLDSVAVAQKLGCSVRNVTYLAARGRLAGDRVGRTWAFTHEAVEGFLADRER